MPNEEEEELADYVIQMADMGFGLTNEDLKRTTYQLAEKLGKSHPFPNGIAGLEGVHSLFCIKELLSVNPETIKDHFAKLASFYALLNILTKPMRIYITLYNTDKGGVSVEHTCKGGKVLSQIGRENAWSISSGERGKYHTIVSCVSISGVALPPFLIYPRKRITDNLKKGAYPGTRFISPIIG